MKTLLITPFPPARDGLATYASQVYSKWRSEGHDVEVLSPEPSAGKSSADLKTLSGMWQAARRARRFERVVVQFHPETFFYAMDPVHFLQGWAGLMLLFLLGGNVEVVVHETPHRSSGRFDDARSALWRVLWRQPKRVCVHSEAERAAMVAEYALDSGRIYVIDHGETFQRRSAVTRDEARFSFGIEADSFVFLCAGFIQPHKGFDRAIRAFANLEGKHLRLVIIGEMRVWTAEHQEYLDLLRGLVELDPRVTLHEGYASDETFDRWIIACDAVVLPYRHIWSSGVAERAALYDRPVIATDVGGLAEQVRSSSRVVRDAETLVAAMSELSASKARKATGNSSFTEGAAGRRARGGLPDRAALQRLVAGRAAVLHDWYDPLARMERPILDVPVSDPLAGHLALPSGQGGVGPKAIAQQVVRRLIDWRVVPIAIYVNALRDQLLGDTQSVVGEVPTNAQRSPEAVRKPSAPQRRRRPSSESEPRS